MKIADIKFLKNRTVFVWGAIGLTALILYGVICLGPESAVAGTTMNTREKRLAAMLSSIEGTGSVEVMIAENESSSVFGDKSAGQGEVQGVIVCAEGAEDLAVYCRLQKAVATALNLQAENIEIYPLNDKKQEAGYAE